MYRTSYTHAIAQHPLNNAQLAPKQLKRAMNSQSLQNSFCMMSRYGITLCLVQVSCPNSILF